ncbi:L-serine dehydratase, alpha subunit [Desulfosporosinus sp. I2]|nr:L-serine dehydratase, alpha subunit [Desulfosporosinus sp. I2]
MALYACGKEQKLWELAIVYECARSGWTVEDILDYMKMIVSVMRRSINDASSQDLKGTHLIKEESWAAREVIEEGMALNMGILSKSVSWALGVMETSSSMGRIVAAPTAGSAGVLPGAILGGAEALGLDVDEAVKAMLAAGMIGVFISEMATFAAEECGCQAECGAASAMAAAGLVQLAGGSASQAIAGASLALQNLLGLVCDPVAGRVEIPCVGRNVMAVANAVTSANLVLACFDPVIPLDEVIQAMYSVGSMLPRELRCTGKGGLCVTPTAQSKKQEFTH